MANGDEAKVTIVQRNFFKTLPGQLIVIISSILLVFVILVTILNYFNFISPSFLSFLPKRSIDITLKPEKITLTENYGFRAGVLTFSCPVDSSFCNSQKLLNINSSDAVSYKASSSSAVLNVTKTPTLDNIAVLADKEKGKKYFYESVISKDTNECYTIAYTLPYDAQFGNILSEDILKEGSKIAALGEGTFTSGDEDVNVLIQVKSQPIDPGVPCSLIQKSPEFFQNF